MLADVCLISGVKTKDELPEVASTVNSGVVEEGWKKLSDQESERASCLRNPFSGITTDARDLEGATGSARDVHRLALNRLGELLALND